MSIPPFLKKLRRRFVLHLIIEDNDSASEETNKEGSKNQDSQEQTMQERHVDVNLLVVWAEPGFSGPVFLFWLNWFDV